MMIGTTRSHFSPSLSIPNSTLAQTLYSSSNSMTFSIFDPFCYYYRPFLTILSTAWSLLTRRTRKKARVPIGRRMMPR